MDQTTQGTRQRETVLKLLAVEEKKKKGEKMVAVQCPFFFFCTLTTINWWCLPWAI